MGIQSGEEVWDYWREDTLLHVFHVIVHELYLAYKDQQPKPPRNDERFWYTHQQLIRRFAILFSESTSV